MNGYIALYNGRQIEVWADTSYAAHVKAVAEFRAPKSRKHLVTVHLSVKADGGQSTTVITS